MMLLRIPAAVDEGSDSYIYSAVSAANFPWNGDSFANGPRFSIGSTILTVGYPDAFYDRYNLRVYSDELRHQRVNKWTGAAEMRFFDTGKVWYYYLIDEIIKQRLNNTYQVLPIIVDN